MSQHRCEDLIAIFNALFKKSENTILIGGAAEPLYLPHDHHSPHNRIFFTQDYFSSALHEIAHWCIAGKIRRQQVDFGYWYNPDGRNTEQQQIFEQVEVKPQALEWIFSMAAGSVFHVSQDNLSAQQPISAEFVHKIQQQALRYLTAGMPKNAAMFRGALLAQKWS